MSSPEEVCEKLYGGKWKVTNLENEFKKGKKQGALEELKKFKKSLGNNKNNFIVTRIKLDYRIKELESEKTNE